MCTRSFCSQKLREKAVRFLILVFIVTSASADKLTDEASIPTPLVRTKYGLIAGASVRVGGKSVDAFLGIPYAKPPVGSLRFEKPQLPDQWSGTLNATVMPKPCWQLPLRFLPNATIDYSDRASEDCLYLNVWKPPSACNSYAERRPVVVFIHGGGFQWGDSSLSVYNPSNFVALSDVVFVTFNYRLSVLGFLSSQAAGIRGNIGLWDQNSVLKWVRENIEQFGGDPTDVTLVGQSAGGISAALHSLSPHSRGLFKRLVLQSGTPFSLFLGIALGGPQKIIFAASAVKCYDKRRRLLEQADVVADCLRKIGAREMFQKLDFLTVFEQLFPPVDEDEFIPKKVLCAETWKDLGVKEILLGSVTDEGTLFFNWMKESVPILSKLLFSDYLTFASYLMSEMFALDIEEGRQLVQNYFGDSEADVSQGEVIQRISKMIGDAVFTCPTFFFAQIAAKQGVDVYRYVFNYRATHSLWPKWMGVVHADDLPYTLGSLPFFKVTENFMEHLEPAGSKSADNLHYNHAEEMFMKDMVGIWSSFAKTGKPVLPGNLSEWPVYTVGKPDFIQMDLNTYTKKQEDLQNVCNIWKPFLLGKNNTMVSDVEAEGEE